jgi:ABC-2 type transport system permease protein
MNAVMKTSGGVRKDLGLSQLRRLREVWRRELQLLFAERSLWIAAALFFLLIGYSLYNSIVQIDARNDAQSEVLRDDANRRNEQLGKLRRIMQGAEPATPFNNPANPEHMAGGYGAHHAWMPPAALGPVALGQSDLFPAQYRVGYESKVSFLQNDDIENPWNLLSGQIDLAFVIIYLLPLLILATSYNLLSAEHESGTLRLLLSQPLALRTLITGKIAARAVVLLTLAIAGPLCLLLAARWHQTLEAGQAAIWWAALVGAYALFWFALVVAVNSLGRSSATNAMVLVIAWVVLVLVLPVLLNFVLTAVHPAPSRTELAARIRVVTAQAMARNEQLLSTDYDHVDNPAQLVPKNGHIAVAGRALGHYKVEREVDDAIRPDLEKFDVQHARQQALLSRLTALTPAAALFDAMTELAGNGARRQAHFLQLIDDHHRAWKGFFFPRIEAGLAISPEDFAAFPRYTWREQSSAIPARVAGLAIAKVSGLAALLFAFAAWRLRRFKVV